MTNSSNEITQAITVLRQGGVVAIPTETVYGLAADITQPKAIEKIYTVKNRPTNHPLIIHIADKKELEQLAVDIPSYVFTLADFFWPGPLTFILKKHPSIDSRVTGGHSTVAVRLPAHPIAQAIIKGLGHPVAAPSANRFGALSPTMPEHVKASLGDSVDYVVEGGRCPVGIESTILEATHVDYCTILRHGMISSEDIRAVLGKNITLKDNVKSDTAAPGNLNSHYCPMKPVLLKNESDSVLENAYILSLSPSFSEKYASHATERIAMPSEPKRYAYQLYFQLHLADASEAPAIVIELPPNTPAWQGILDKLKKMS